MDLYGTFRFWTHSTAEWAAETRPFGIGEFGHDNVTGEWRQGTDPPVTWANMVRVMAPIGAAGMSLIAQATQAGVQGIIQFLNGPPPVLITPIVGGSQAFTALALADVTGSTISLAANTPYEVEWLATHSAAATTTGAFFSVGGTAVAPALYFTTKVFGDVLATDSSTRVFNTANGGQAFTSSRATTLNKVLIRTNIRTTTSGSAILRCATEVNGSAITVTALQGYSRII